MRWHRNPFFHTAVLPPSVNPSARPSADLDTATAAAVAAAAAHSRAQSLANSTRPSTDRPTRGQPVIDENGVLQGPTSDSNNNNNNNNNNNTIINEDSKEESNPRTSTQLPRHSHSTKRHSHHTPQGLLAEAAARAAASRRSVHFSRRVKRKKPKVPKLTIFEPSDHLTGYQFFYIFILDGIGAMILSGGINFALAYAMYKSQNTRLHPIRLFQFPNTIAGDATVTIFVQCVLTWFIELFLVNQDLKTGKIQPIGFVSEPTWPLLRWFLLLDRHPSGSSSSPSSSSPSDSDDDNRQNSSSGGDDLRRPLSHVHDENCRCHQHHESYEPGSWRHWAYFLISQLIRALIIGVFSFCVMWGPAMGIMTAVGRHGADNDYWFDAPTWAPEIFKLVYGGVLALWTTPPFAAFWLIRCGWALQANHRHLATADLEAGGGSGPEVSGPDDSAMEEV